MAKSISIDSSQGKLDQYRQLSYQLKALYEDEPNLYANLANTAAVLKEAFGFFWVGFYLKDSNRELVLGPFQGPLACTRIMKGNGVCGKAWEQMRTQFVPDVDQYPGHIACSSFSKSEVVVPLIRKDGEIWGVLDVDQSEVEAFGQVDQEGLELIAKTLSDIAVADEKS